MTAINKYNTSMIYSIRSPHTDKYYIGSTTQKLCKRFSDHKINYKLYLKGSFSFVTSFKLLELGDAYIELLEEINCDNKTQLEKREGEFIREHKTNCVNKCIVGRTRKEWHVDNKEHLKDYANKYYETNKEHIKDYANKYYETNKEHIKEHMKDYYESNKEHKQEYDKQYAIDNKKKIQERNKIRYDNKQELLVCECGSSIRTSSNLVHIKSIKHIKFLEQQIMNNLNIA